MVGLIIRESELGTRPNERTLLVHLVYRMPPQPGNRCHRRRSRSCLPPSFVRSFASRARAPFYSFPSAFRGKQHFSARRTDRQRQRDSARVVVVIARGRNCPRGFSYASALLLLLARDPFPVRVRRPSPSFLVPSAPVNARALRFCRSGAAAAQELSVPQEVGGGAFGGGGDGEGKMEEWSRSKGGGGKVNHKTRSRPR